MEYLGNDVTENLYIGTLNVTLDNSQYKVEKCDQHICPSGFAAWVCAENFNPDWWAKHMSSIASVTKITNWLMVLTLIMMLVPKQ